MPRITIRVIPNASRNEIISREAPEWKIKLHAVPEDGKANKELIRFLAKELGVSKSAIQIVAGEKARTKVIEWTDPKADS